MKTAIRFKGLTQSRDELATENGELALCGGLEICDGALRASVLKGVQKVNIGTNKTLLYVHKLTDPDTPVVYIVLDGSDNKLYSIVGSTTEEICELSSIGGKVASIEAVGNTVVIIGNRVKCYALWKQDENKYIFLGEKPDFIDMRFRLSESQNVDYFDTSAVTITESASGMNGKSSASFGSFQLESGATIGDVFDGDKIKEEYQSKITDMIWATVNKANSAITEHNRFYAPFFVRYCYRMYDGSMYMHSAPVLLLTIEDTANQVVCLNARANSMNLTGSAKIPLWSNSGVNKFNYNGITAMYVPINASLQYCIMSSSNTLSEIKKWKDVISSVDVFISQPIFHYNTGVLIKELTTDNEVKLYSGNSVYKNYNLVTDSVLDNANDIKKYSIPRLVNGEENGDYTNISTFFKAYSFNISDLEHNNTYTDLPMQDGTVGSITGREKMTDDYKSHNKLRADGQYIYNKRVNLYGMSELLFDGFSLAEMASICFGLGSTRSINKIRVKLETNEGLKIVGLDVREGISDLLLKKVPLYYPDARAVEMKLLYTVYLEEEELEKVITLKMKAASELNGSWTDVTSFVDEDKSTTNWPELTSKELSMNSKIYTSEVNNPFYFPVNGINTVGIGEIRGLAATTRALSQGQFGQYPLLAFSTDGIWALSVSSTGTYSAIHPLSREVCENPDSILQLDQSILFATNRGLNQIVESNISLISGMLDGPKDDLVKSIADNIADDDCDDYLNFNKEPNKFFVESKGVYDPVNSRVILFNTKDETLNNIAMVLSLKDGTWSTIKVDEWKNVVNGYPYPFIQYSNGVVEELSSNYDYSDTQTHKGVLVTRTLNFDGLIKAIQGWEHVSEGNAPKMVIYGSNDLKSGWKKIGTSERMIADSIPGYPFKYFRIGLQFSIKVNQRYSHLILDVIEKYSHQ